MHKYNIVSLLGHSRVDNDVVDDDHDDQEDHDIMKMMTMMRNFGRFHKSIHKVISFSFLARLLLYSPFLSWLHCFGGKSC